MAHNIDADTITAVGLEARASSFDLHIGVINAPVAFLYGCTYCVLTCGVSSRRALGRSLHNLVGQPWLHRSLVLLGAVGSTSRSSHTGEVDRLNSRHRLQSVGGNRDSKEAVYFEDQTLVITREAIRTDATALMPTVQQ